MSNTTDDIMNSSKHQVEHFLLHWPTDAMSVGKHLHELRLDGRLTSFALLLLVLCNQEFVHQHHQFFRKSPESGARIVMDAQKYHQCVQRQIHWFKCVCTRARTLRTGSTLIYRCSSTSP